MAEETKLIVDVSQVIAALDDVDKQIAGLEKDLNGLQGSIQEAFDPKAIQKYAASAGTGADQVDTLRQKLDEVDKTGTKISGKKFIGADVIKNIQVGGKSLGEWNDNLGNVAGKLEAAAEGTAKMSTAQKILNVILKASPILLLVGVIASVIAYFGKFQSGIDKVSQVTAGLNAVIDVLINRFLKFGSSIVNLFSGNFTQAFEDLKGSVAGLGTELVNAAVNAAALEREFQAIRDASITASVVAERQKAAVAELATVYDNEAKSFSARIAAAKEAGAIEKQIAEDAFDLALRRRQAALADFQQNTEIQAKKEALAKAEEELIRAQKDLSEASFGAEERLRNLRKQAAEERQKQMAKEIAELEKLAASIQKLKLAATPEGLEKELAQVEQKYNDLAAEAEKGIKKLQEIEAKRGLTPEQRQQLQDLADISVKIEEQRLSALIDVLTDFNEKDAKLNEEQIKRRQELAEKEGKAAMDGLKAEKEARDAAIALQEERGNRLILIMEKTGVKQEEIETAKKAFQLATQKARLESELQFQQALLAITDAGDTKQIDSIKQKISLIQEQLKSINLDLSVPDFKKKKPQSLLELLGVDIKDVPLVEEATKQIVSSLQQIAAARVEAADAAVEAADRQVSAAEDALQREIELAELGFANNVEKRQAELESAKAARQQSIAEQVKAQKQQLIIDSTIQASNIITSTTNLIKSWSSLPFGVGLLAAAAQIAAIFALIASIKAKSRAISGIKARRGTEGFLTGDGIVQGKMHSQGGQKLEVERGELVQVLDTGARKKVHVIRRENVRKYSELLTAANEGNDQEVIQAAFAMADFKQLPQQVQQQVFNHYLQQYAQTADISNIPAGHQDRMISSLTERIDTAYPFALSVAKSPDISRKKVAKRVEKAARSGMNVAIDNARTNEILERMLMVMISQGQQKAEETWTNNGKTRIRGGVITNFKR